MTSKLWGGGYRRKTLPAIERFTASIAVDQRLALEDLEGSLAHARMLGKCRIIPVADARRLVQGLDAVRRDWLAGRIAIDPAAEDIHSVLHHALAQRVGAAVDHLHTARSRNDQVITDTRLHGLRAARRLIEEIRRLQRAIVQTAAKHRALVVPGYTHLQHAQPVLWAHLLLAYCEGLERDCQRLLGVTDRLDELPLGSGALAGTSLPIDRRFVARQLGFSRIAANSIDAVSDRDTLLELVAALAIVGTHLSRIAEDLILWVHPEIGFLALDESLCTGSSMMPQKQNPDFLELTRAGAGQLIGLLTGFLSVCKGLPSGYNRDLQLDKVHLFAALDAVDGMLSVLTQGLPGITVQRSRIEAALCDEALYATDLAEYLVAKGVSFAQAHRAVGELMGHCRRQHQQPSELTLATLQRFSTKFAADVRQLFDPAVSVARKRSPGSTNPRLVAGQLRQWWRRLRGTRPVGYPSSGWVRSRHA